MMMIAAPAAWLPLMLPPILLLLLGSAREASAITNQEFSGLKSLQAAIYYIDGNGNKVPGIPNWPDLTAQPSSFDPCTVGLAGIGCDNSAITVVDFTAQGLYNDQPLDGLNDLHSLQYIYLSQNHFTGPLPALSAYNALYIIHASDNSFSGEVPSEWSNLIELREL
eukprot:jgi/Chlat1/20/ChrspC228299S00904